MTPGVVWGEDYGLLVRDYKQFFRTDDKIPLDVMLATVASGAWDADPLWVYVVGPPSSGKTELLRAVDFGKDGPFTLYLSSIKPHSLISGLRDGKDLLPLLDKKTLVVKDLTMMLEMDRHARDELFGNLRDAYDGTYSVSYGTVGMKRYDSHFNFLAAVTPAIEEYNSVQSVLGQRFLLVRTRFPKEYHSDASRKIVEFRHRFNEGARTIIERGKTPSDRPSLPSKLKRVNDSPATCRFSGRTFTGKAGRTRLCTSPSQRDRCGS